MGPPAEISIPTTSQVPGTGGEKPYTLYNITLRLPLRSFVVQKRYSEFSALHATLTSHVGEAPPAPLPAKTWFRSTVGSPELAEDRRVQLEAYLRAIAESPDRRWRDTTAWRAFVNLPSTGGSASSSSRNQPGVTRLHEQARLAEGRLPAIGLAAANAAAASDPGTWIDLHKEMKKALHDARQQLARRDAADGISGGGGGGAGGRGVSNSTSTAAVEAGVAAKRALIQAGSLLSALTTGLQALQEAKRLAAGELRRRRDLLAAARVERDGLETLSANLGRPADGASTGGGGGGGGSGGYNGRQTPTGDKAALFSGAAGAGGGSASTRLGGRVLGAPLPETERTREHDNAGVLQLQRDMMSEQDEAVAALGKMVERQRTLALAVDEEVTQQKAMLDRMHEDVDRVQNKVKAAKGRTKNLS